MRLPSRLYPVLSGLWLMLALAAGCVQPALDALPTAEIQGSVQRSVQPMAPAVAGAMAAQPAVQAGAIRLAVAPGVPEPIARAAQQALIQAGIKVEVADRAGLLLTAEPPAAGSASDGGLLVYERIFVPVDRFSTILEGITWDELAGVWSGTASTRNFATLYPAAEALPELTALLGQPGPAVKPRPALEVADALWSDPMGLGILPFDALTLRVRGLRLDGLAATDRRLPTGRWPLAGRAWLRATGPENAASLARLPAGLSTTNRDLGRLTTVTMTGVTALTRGTAAAIARAHDPAFPARLVGPELAAADITTTSNEVSFLEGCAPDNRTGLATFCADPAYFAALELSGIKLVGLTGNHLNDFGTAAFLKTLDLYESKGVLVYGGGANDADAWAPLIVRDHGNTLAFIGANQFGPATTWTHDGEKVSAWATTDSPGSARYDAERMRVAIAGLRPQANVIFAELQYLEVNPAGDYQAEPLPGQPGDFRGLLDAGANVVTGVQAHAPQAAELRGGGLILYGLGNLYFDQTWSWPTRTGLVARHTVYAGRLINTELLVTVIQDDMQVRWATPEERVRVLRTVFAASGW